MLSNLTVLARSSNPPFAAHFDEIGREHAIDAFEASLGRRGAHLLGRRTAAEVQNDLRRMNPKLCIGRDLAGGGAEHQIGAGRIARRAARRQIGMEFAAGLLQLEADIAVLGFEAALLHHRSPNPGCDGPFAQCAPIISA